MEARDVDRPWRGNRVAEGVAVRREWWARRVAGERTRRRGEGRSERCCEERRLV